MPPPPPPALATAIHHMQTPGGPRTGSRRRTPVSGCVSRSGPAFARRAQGFVPPPEGGSDGGSMTQRSRLLITMAALIGVVVATAVFLDRERGLALTRSEAA